MPREDLLRFRRVLGQVKPVESDFAQPNRAIRSAPKALHLGQCLFPLPVDRTRVQSDGVMDEPDVLARHLPVHRPVVRRGADRDHRLQAGGPRPGQRVRQQALAGKGFQMRVGVDQGHGRSADVLVLAILIVIKRENGPATNSGYKYNAPYLSRR